MFQIKGKFFFLTAKIERNIHVVSYYDRLRHTICNTFEFLDWSINMSKMPPLSISDERARNDRKVNHGKNQGSAPTSIN